MPFCASCRTELSGDLAICPHHHSGDLGWSKVNRDMCDFIHRRKVPEYGPSENFSYEEMV